MSSVQCVSRASKPASSQAWREEKNGLGKKKEAPQGQQESKVRKKQKRMGKAVVSNPRKAEGQWTKCFSLSSKSLLRALPSARPPKPKPFNEALFKALSEIASANQTLIPQKALLH